MATIVTNQPSNGDERRRFPRFNMALDVAFGPMGSEGASPKSDQLERTVSVNISLGGLCLYSRTLYPVGTSIFCRVTLPGEAEPIDVVTQAVWFQKVDHEAHGYKLGLEFAEISSKVKAALKKLFDQPPAAQKTRATTLLLVDDDRELQLALKLRFESAGFKVITASEGLEALRKGREEHPSAIILDLMLPRLNGYEVCRLLKFDQKFSHIPIMLITARSRKEDVEMGYSVGADSFMTKPFDGTELIARVEELLRKNGR